MSLNFSPSIKHLLPFYTVVYLDYCSRGNSDTGFAIHCWAFSTPSDHNLQINAHGIMKSRKGNFDGDIFCI